MGNKSLCTFFETINLSPFLAIAPAKVTKLDLVRLFLRKSLEMDNFFHKVL